MEYEDYPEILGGTDEDPANLHINVVPTDEERYERVWQILGRMKSGNSGVPLVY